VTGAEILPAEFRHLAPGFLLGARIGGLVLVAPVFSAKTLPPVLRAALVLVLTVALLGAVPPAAGTPAFTPMTLVSETAVGWLLGFGAALAIGAAELAGETLAVQTGLSGARTLNPLESSQVSVLGYALNLLLVILFISLEGHVLMLEALARSLDVAPLGGGVDLAAASGSAAAAGARVFLLGAQFAAPVIAALVVGNAALGILARTVPQMNVLMVAFPVQIGVGLVTLGMSLPYLAAGFSGWPSDYEAWAERMLRALVGGG
jgi:flagellar biosynthetic protein FliR